MPRFSVVIPCYNGEAFLADTLRSALLQSENDLEIVVVNDGSTDRSLAIVETFQTDGRIRIISQPNAGLGAARNTGLEAARGEYINFLDADDLLEPAKLAVQGRMLDENPSVDLVLCDGWMINERGAVTDEHLLRADRLAGGTPLFEALFMGGFFPPLVPLVRRSAALAAGRFHSERDLGGWADTAFWMRMALNGAGYRVTGERLCRYRRYDGNMSSSRIGMDRAAAGIYAHLMRDRPEDCARGLRYVHQQVRERDVAIGALRGRLRAAENGLERMAGDLLVARRRSWERMVSSLRGRDFVVWGAGLGGRRVLALLQRAGSPPRAIVDSDPGKQGTFVEGLRVLPPTQLDGFGSGRVFVVVASTQASSIREILCATGRNEGADFSVIDFDDVEAAEGLFSIQSVTARYRSDPPDAARLTALQLADKLRGRPEGPLAIYGAGEIGRQLLSLLAEAGESVAVVVDSGRAVWGSTVAGVVCHPPTALVGSGCSCVVVASQAFAAEIHATINRLFAEANEKAPHVVVPA